MGKSLNWRHNGYEVPGSRNVDGTGVLLCIILYGGWGDVCQSEPIFCIYGNSNITVT